MLHTSFAAPEFVPFGSVAGDHITCAMARPFKNSKRLEKARGIRLQDVQAASRAAVDRDGS